MTSIYTLTVTDWTQRRSYANSGRGWRVRLFSMPRYYVATSTSAGLTKPGHTAHLSGSESE